MAKNMVHTPGDQLNVVKASVVSGDPIVVGQMPGVALTCSESGTNNVTMKRNGVFNLSVKGIDGGGNSAVAIGDILYHTAADTPPLSKKATGVRFGYALEAVNSAATGTIKVAVGY